MTDEGFSLDKFIDSAARSLTARYRSWVEFDDVKSEMRAYLLQEAKRFANWEAGQEFFRIRRALIGAGKSYCVREKITRTGNVYDYEDIAWYSGAAVARLAPLAADPLFDGFVSEGDSGNNSAKRDPKEGGTLLAAVMDVRRGLDKFGPLPGDPESDEYAEHCERIAEFLGGESPESAAPRVGSRRVISNETARLVLRRQGE